MRQERLDVREANSGAEAEKCSIPLGRVKGEGGREKGEGGGEGRKDLLSRWGWQRSCSRGDGSSSGQCQWTEGIGR